MNINDYHMTDLCEAALKRYIEHHLPPGSFLTAVITNNLKEAVMNADHWNLGNIPAYVNYLYNHAPSQCWGSPARMTAWLSLSTKED